MQVMERDTAAGSKLLHFNNTFANLETISLGHPGCDEKNYTLNKKQHLCKKDREVYSQLRFQPFLYCLINVSTFVNLYFSQMDEYRKNGTINIFTTQIME
jgi:hypothetical protein